MYVFRILLNNDAQQNKFTSVEKLQRKLYINNESITQKTCFRPMYRLFVLEACHICTASLKISLHGNVNNSELDRV